MTPEHKNLKLHGQSEWKTDGQVNPTDCFTFRAISINVIMIKRAPI